LSDERTANAIATTGADVNVDAAAPPTLGQVLKATSATTSTWQDPLTSTAGYYFFGLGGNAVSEVGDYAGVSVGANASVNITLQFPPDFSSLTTLLVFGIPTNTFVDEDIDLTSSYAAAGELYNNHQESDTTSLYSGTADTIMTIDISGLFTSAAGGDIAGIQIDHNAIGTSINYLGLAMGYVVS
jgi:hypothetical protein